MATDPIHVPETTGAPAAPPEEPLTGWRKVRLVALVILKRLRFIAVLATVGLFIGYWDTVLNYWEKWTQPRAATSRKLPDDEEFFCRMDPQVIRPEYEPNGGVPKCPICGMPLSIHKKGEAAKLPKGVTARVQLSPERVQLAGIKTAPIEYRAAIRETKTVGYIAYDERRLSRIVSRVDGYVERLYVDETFAVVHKDDVLAEIYSPDLFSTARELVLATRDGSAPDLATAARNKLRLLGVSKPEIDAIVASGKASPRLVIRSPQSGYVVEKKIVEGASVEAKMTLFEVADLSTVWVEADVYEKDIPFLQAGQRVEAKVEAWPNRVFEGKLALIYPRLDTTTRSNRIRFELDNVRHELRPGMFATVRIETPLENIEPFKSMAAKSGRVVTVGFRGASAPPAYEFLSVPEAAVIDTGAKKVVYVEREPGVFEGMEVELGPRNGEYYPVVKGLKPGDKVAAAGAFLIDAETPLNPAAASTYFGASGGAQPTVRPATPAPSQRQDKEPPAEESRPDSGTAKATLTAEQMQNIEQLPEADRKLAVAQRVCPITGAALGSMGVPVKIVLQGRVVFLCCKGCVSKAKQDPEATLKKLSDAGRKP